MADKKGWERIGLVFGLITAAVVLTGAMVVKGNLEGGAGLEKAPMVAASLGAFTR